MILLYQVIFSKTSLVKVLFVKVFLSQGKNKVGWKVSGNINRLFLKSGPFHFLTKQIDATMNYRRYISALLLSYVLFLSELLSDLLCLQSTVHVFNTLSFLWTLLKGILVVLLQNFSVIYCNLPITRSLSNSNFPWFALEVWVIESQLYVLWHTKDV